MIHTDAPVVNIDDDLLNRKSFIESLSNAIINYSSKDCLTIGLIGKWGSGKTSILNFLIENLENNGEFIFIRFNPWYFSNQENLLFYFFEELSNIDFPNKKHDIELLLRKYNKYINMFSFRAGIPKYFEVNIDPNNFDEKEFETFNSIKFKLMNYFEELNSKVIITIDDIDRLNGNEIKQIFTLVKSLADFPNVIYVLSFDKEYVFNQIDDYSEEYIEKIIQIPILVPEITQTKLNSLVYEYIEPIFLKNMSVENKFLDNGFFEFHRLLSPFFKNLRDIKRYMNVVNFYSNISDEIQLVDLLIILALQVFEYDVYLEIKNNKELLTLNDLYFTIPDSSYSFHDEINNIYNKLINMFKNYDSRYRGALLGYLFPIFDEFNEFDVTGVKIVRVKYFNDNLRICHNNNFDKYFTLSLEENEVSNHLIENMLLKDNSDEISNIILSLKKNDKLKSLFDNLFDKIKDMSIDFCKALANSLINIGDELLSDDFIRYNNQVFLLLKELFNKIESDEFCFNILFDAFKQDKNLFTPIEFIYSIGYDYGLFNKKQIKSKEYDYIALEQLNKLIKIACDKINYLSKKDLFLNDNLRLLLVYWRNICCEEIVQKFVEENTVNDSDFINFLKKFLKKYNYASKKFNFDFDELINYFKPEDLISRVKEISENGDADQKEFCEFFFKRAKRSSLKNII